MTLGPDRAQEGTSPQGTSNPNGTAALSGRKTRRTTRSAADQSVHSPQGNYLYERLTEKAFQRMCNALLADKFPEVTCMPVGQRDGGRDAVLQTGMRSIIYQVKWTSNFQKDPVSWLNQAIEGERSNIERLVAEGAEKYYLLTSLAGTGVPSSGTMDRLDEALKTHSIAFGIPVKCWWRADIDARLDASPDSLKWSYADMLAGWDLIRYLIQDQQLAAQDQSLRDLLMKVIATQCAEDSKVKFKQVDLASYSLGNLFVDVEAKRVTEPGNFGRVYPSDVKVGGTASYLLNTGALLTLVHGAPGQGKSTLGQYLCQVHRRTFLDNQELFPGALSEATASQTRLPLRIDLRDYASWMAGRDPFQIPGPDGARRKASRRRGSLESFIARFLEAKSGDLLVTPHIVREIIERFSLLLVLDGLDEVAQLQARVDVVRNIGEFCARLEASARSSQVVVTSRPNSSGLPEPSPDLFETIALQPLSSQLREDYLEKWSDAQSISDDDRVLLRRIFRTRSIESHIAQLSESPMQLTILLYLIQKRGDSIPRDRTELYRSYMQTFLDREAAKSPAVQKYRSDLEEVTGYLGWHLQSLSESTGVLSQLPIKKIKREILFYLHEVNKDVSLVDELFTAVTDKVWALSSKKQGTFQFDVQSMQEYFAAKHLYEIAGAEQRNFDASEVFRHLVRRPYWQNTCRFYAGFSAVNTLTSLADVLDDEFRTSRRPAHIRTVAWTLLVDGVFEARPKTQAQVAALFDDDLSIILIYFALETGTLVSLISADSGGEIVLANLLDKIVAEPLSPVSALRTELAVQLSRGNESFHQWWQSHMRSAMGNKAETAWLRHGIAHRAGSQLDDHDLDQLTLTDVAGAQVALDAGVNPSSDSRLHKILKQAILKGQCGELLHPGPEPLTDLALILSPLYFLAKARTAIDSGSLYAVPVGHNGVAPTDRQRLSAARRLKDDDPRFLRMHEVLRIRKGEKGSAAPWANTARLIADIFGPCWPAAEIAIIGAATSSEHLRNGGDLTVGSEPLGDHADYGRLLIDSRFNRSQTSWWKAQFSAHDDPLSRASWALALVGLAHGSVVHDCLALLDEVTGDLPVSRLHVLTLASSRLGASGVNRRLDIAELGGLDNCNLSTVILLSHHLADLREGEQLLMFSEERLSAIAASGVTGWPGSRALTARMLEKPTESLLNALRSCSDTNHLRVNKEFPVGTYFGNLPRHFAEAILVEPGAFPVVWVLAAEQRISPREEESLSEIAVSQRWFAE